MTDQTRVDYDWAALVAAYEQEEEEIEYDFTGRQYKRGPYEDRGSYGEDD